MEVQNRTFVAKYFTHEQIRTSEFLCSRASYFIQPKGRAMLSQIGDAGRVVVSDLNTKRPMPFAMVLISLNLN